MRKRLTKIFSLTNFSFYGIMIYGKSGNVPGVIIGNLIERKRKW